jgi:sulfhydrogenase subunit delta
MKYLGVEISKPKVAIFDFTGCEGCELQMVNKEDTLVDFLSLIEVVNFREGISDRGEDYDIAFVEGSISRADEVERIKKIRKQAKVLVAMGACATFGGVNQMRNKYAEKIDWLKSEVYGKDPIETNNKVMAIDEVVPVDLKVYGCPISKAEVEKIVGMVVLGKEFKYPTYPVCMECKANGNICLFDLGKICLGPITRAGCNAICCNSKRGCFGCRGPADEPNIEEMKAIMKKHGFTKEDILEKLELYGGFPTGKEGAL